MTNLKNGFYKVEFHAALPGAGGLVAVEDGKIRGGDNGYLYSGTVTQNDGQIRSKIRVSARGGQAVSVFGTVGQIFELTLAGKVDGNRFHLVGAAPAPGIQGIEITGTFIAEF